MSYVSTVAQGGSKIEEIGIAGEAGRPDLTCRAPSGIFDRNGRPLEVDRIVVEAKDEHDAFSTIGKLVTWPGSLWVSNAVES
ncbi:MAG: hypothetical protein E5V21_05020 [Mesorhizobium sp.]|nr:MAG: hypothetical protein E5V21_05020 [Mesorhizobium sp.]